MFFPLRLSLRFLIVLGSALVPFWPKWALGRRRKVTPLASNWGYSAHWAIPDGHGIVLVRSCFRVVVWGRFFDLLKLLLGSFWAASGPVLALFGPLSTIWGHSWGHFRPPWGRCSVVGAVLQPCLSQCSLFAFRFSLLDFPLNLSRLDLNVRIASKEPTHPRGAVPTQPQARTPPDTRERQLQDGRVEAGHSPGLADCALRD